MCVFHVFLFKFLGVSALVEKVTLVSSVPNPSVRASNRPLRGAGESSVPHITTKTEIQPLLMPPLLELPQVCGDGLSLLTCHVGEVDV